MPRKFTLVLGGARSGKSALAENLLAAYPAPRLYIATAEAGDAEMQARIAHHRARRGPGWITREVPLDLPAAVSGAGDLPVLVDCLTLWLSNLILAGRDPAEAAAALATPLEQRSAPTVCVANEVGLGLVPETALGRLFRDEAGRLHQRLAALADEVILMVAGCPLTLKAAPVPSSSTYYKAAKGLFRHRKRTWRP